MKRVSLGRDSARYAVVDDADYERVSRLKWHIHSRGYASSTVRNPNGTNGTILLHRFVMGVSGKIEIDHANGNKLDCRRSNLRICDRSQNLYNTKIRSDSSSGYRGVSFSKDKRKWMAYVNKHGKRVWSGYFDTPEEAARERDGAAKKIGGDFARMNF